MKNLLMKNLAAVTLVFLISANLWAGSSLVPLDFIAGKWIVSSSFFENGQWKKTADSQRAVVEVLPT